MRSSYRHSTAQSTVLPFAATPTWRSTLRRLKSLSSLVVLNWGSSFSRNATEWLSFILITKPHSPEQVQLSGKHVPQCTHGGVTHTWRCDLQERVLSRHRTQGPSSARRGWQHLAAHLLICWAASRTPSFFYLVDFLIITFSLFIFTIWMCCLPCRSFDVCVPGPCGGQKRTSDPWDRSYRWLWATVPVLGVKPGPSQPVFLTSELCSSPNSLLVRFKLLVHWHMTSDDSHSSRVISVHFDASGHIHFFKNCVVTVHFPHI